MANVASSLSIRLATGGSYRPGLMGFRGTVYINSRPAN